MRGFIAFACEWIERRRRKQEKINSNGFYFFTFADGLWFSFCLGSSNGHSPVLNLSKSGGADQGSTGDQSDRSEAHSPAHSIRDEDENISDDNISDVDERDDNKDEGELCVTTVKQLFFSIF